MALPPVVFPWRKQNGSTAVADDDSAQPAAVTPIETPPQSMAPGLGTPGGAPADADSPAKPVDPPQPVQPVQPQKPVLEVPAAKPQEDQPPEIPGAKPVTPTTDQPKKEEPKKDQSDAPVIPGAKLVTPAPTPEKPKAEPQAEQPDDQPPVIPGAKPVTPSVPFVPAEPAPPQPVRPPPAIYPQVAEDQPDTQEQISKLVQQGHTPGSAQALANGQTPKTISGEPPAPPKPPAPPTTTYIAPPMINGKAPVGSDAPSTQPVDASAPAPQQTTSQPQTKTDTPPQINVNRFHPGVSLEGTDPVIREIVTAAANALPVGFTIRPTSGMRSAGQGQHTLGKAVDFQIYDPQGKPVVNRGDDTSGLYTLLAKNAYGYQEKFHPELTGKFQWGGQFGTSTANNPNEPDLMHFDLGGRRGRIARYSRESIGAALPPDAGVAPTLSADNAKTVKQINDSGLNATRFGYTGDPWLDPESAKGHGKWISHMIPGYDVALNAKSAAMVGNPKPGSEFEYAGRKWRYGDKVPEIYSDARFDIFDPNGEFGDIGGGGGKGGGPSNNTVDMSTQPAAQPDFQSGGVAPGPTIQPRGGGGGGGGADWGGNQGGGGGGDFSMRAEPVMVFGDQSGPSARQQQQSPRAPQEPAGEDLVSALVKRGFTPQQAASFMAIAPGKGVDPISPKTLPPAAPSALPALPSGTTLNLPQKQPMGVKLLSPKQLMPGKVPPIVPPAAPSAGPDPSVIQGLMKRGFTREQAVSMLGKGATVSPGIGQTAKFRPPPAAPPAAPAAPPKPTPQQLQAAAPPVATPNDQPKAAQKQAPPEAAHAEEQQFSRPPGSTRGDPTPPGHEEIFNSPKLKDQAEAHAANLSDDDPRVKKQDDGYIKGEHFVEGDPWHEDMRSKLPYGKGGQQDRILGEAQTAIGDSNPMHVSYISAPKEAEKFPTRESRKMQYEEYSPEERQMGITEGQLVGHSMIPVAMGVKLPNPKEEKEGKPHQSYIQGISTNVMANNFQHINDKLATMGRKTPYEKLGPKFYNDLEGYYHNLNAGHTATGRGYAVGTGDHPNEPDRSHVPYKLTRKEADFIGGVINNTAAFAKHGDAQKIRELAKANGTLITPEGETNRMLHDIEQADPGWSGRGSGKKGRVLEPSIMTFRTGLVHEIHPSEEHMPETIRPGKEYQGLTKAIARTSQQGRPDIPIAASLHHTFEDNRKINQIERDFSDHKIDEAAAREALKGLGEDPDDYRFVGGSGGLITPYEDDPEALTPEEHTQMKSNLRQQWVSGKMNVEDYRKKSAEVPLPQKPSQPPAAPKPVAEAPEPPKVTVQPEAKTITPPTPKPKPKPVTAPETPEPESSIEDSTPPTPKPPVTPPKPKPAPEPEETEAPVAKAPAKAPAPDESLPEKPADKPAKEEEPDDQSYSSKDTSINKNQLPAVFSKVDWKQGTKNIDVGGGKYDTATDYLKDKGVENHIHDKYNRSEEHNASVHKPNSYDTATISNVLNVIPEKKHRLKTIELAHQNLKPGGKVHVTTYAAPKSGPTGGNKWQNPQKLADYLDEVKEHFPDASIKNGMIVGTKQAATPTAAPAPGEPLPAKPPAKIQPVAAKAAAPAPDEPLPAPKVKAPKAPKALTPEQIEDQKKEADRVDAATDRDNIEPADQAQMDRLNRVSKAWVKKNPDVHDLSLHAHLTGKRQFPGTLKNEHIGEYYDANNPRLDYEKDEHQDRASDAVVHDVMHSLAGTTTGGKPSSAYGWYDRTVRKSLNKAAEIAPKILTHPDHEMAFKLAWAITSQGQDVYPNTESTWHAYNHWIKTGRLPESREVFGGGLKAEQMEENFAKINKLWHGDGDKDKGLGTEGLRKLLMQRMTVGQMKKKFPGLDVAGELAHHEVNGAMSLGAKIGAFFSNLNGDFEPTTMDLWFSRNMNLMAGNMFKFSDEATRVDRMEKGKLVKSHLSQLKAALDSGKLTSVDPARAQKMSDEISALMAHPEGKLDRPAARALAPEIYNWARDQHRAYQRSYGSDAANEEQEGSYHKDFKTPENLTAKKLDEGTSKLSDAPRNGTEREWWRGIMSKATAKLKAAGVKLTNADKQALLWFNIKDVFKMAGSPQRDKADYLDAVYTLVRKVKEGALPGLSPESGLEKLAEAGNVAHGR